MKFRPVPGQATPRLMDVAKFHRALLSGSKTVCDGFGGGAGGVTVVRVPGRLDVMGGIADYCGSVVCEGTLEQAAVLGLQARKDREIHIRSVGVEKDGLSGDFVLSIGDLYRSSRLLDYASAAKFFGQDDSTRWAAYLAGCFYVLLREKVAASMPSGFDMVLHSDVPLGSGISSSAAIEVAAMHALNVKLGLGLEGLELARLCQLVENRVVGAPCGIMDQVVTTLGKQDHLLAIKCQPGEVLGTVRLPDECAVAGINSRVKHSVGGSQYTDVRVGAFMGHKIILDRLRVSPKADPFQGYLANISPAEYRRDFYARLPSAMKGQDFLRRHGDTVDRVTTVDPEKTYKVRSRAEHPIYENHRVCEFIKCLDQARETGDERALVRAGKLMYASHYSYRCRCGLDSPETLLLPQSSWTKSVSMTPGRPGRQTE